MDEANKDTKSDTQKQKLLNISLPTYRQAYSDRTSWMMAYMSELAYIRFNPALPNNIAKIGLEKAINKVVSDISNANVKKAIQLISSLMYDHKEEELKLKSELDELNNAKLVETFDSEGTQAILVETDSFYILAFRGTEATSLNDIKADANAITTKCVTAGSVHSGFKNAFETVEADIVNTLNDLEEKKPLMITGHSLGGALATIAAKRLSFKNGIGACYTFGSPRVGDSEWISTIKTPIYRIVNAADAVTMLPPNGLFIGALSSVLGSVPWIGPTMKKFLLAKVNGYMHGGNMRYLTNCPSGDYSSVKLLYSVSLIYRLKAFVSGKLPYKKFLADHSISIYRKKLAIVAKSRNLSL